MEIQVLSQIKITKSYTETVSTSGKTEYRDSW